MHRVAEESAAYRMNKLFLPSSALWVFCPFCNPMLAMRKQWSTRSAIPAEFLCAAPYRSARRLEYDLDKATSCGTKFAAFEEMRSARRGPLCEKKALLHGALPPEVLRSEMGAGSRLPARFMREAAFPVYKTLDGSILRASPCRRLRKLN
jgi:hypothetical protein